MPFAKRILVATDFSDRARAAFEPARELAALTGAEVLLVHVLDRSVPHPSHHGHRLASVAESDAELEAELARLGEEAFSGDRSRTLVVVDDDVPEGICKVAEDEDCDLIVIATQGVTGVARLLLGSVAESVVRHAHRPVLTIRAPEEGHSPDESS